MMTPMFRSARHPNNPLLFFELTPQANLKPVRLIVLVGTFMASLLKLEIPFFILLFVLTVPFYQKTNTFAGYIILGKMLIFEILFGLLAAEAVKYVFQLR